MRLSTGITGKRCEFELADASGGRVAFPRNPLDLLPTYEQIARELGTAYSLGYISSNPVQDGSFRKIDVRVRDGSARIRQSRDGYFAR